MVASVAVLNDIHGNLPALEAVLAELDQERVEIVCGGDVLSGAYQGECLGLLRERNAHFLKGNSEREVLAGTGGNEWAAAQLSKEERAFVSSWPAAVSLDIAEIGRVLFCHGSPRSDEEILTVLTPDHVLRDALQAVAADMVVIGHTHHQFEKAVDGVRLVNAGSVGLPYEGAAGAYWTLIGPDVVFCRTHYDIDAAAERLRASGMPGIDDLLPESLLAPLPRDEVARYFEQQARPKRG